MFPENVFSHVIVAAVFPRRELVVRQLSECKNRKYTTLLHLFSSLSPHTHTHTRPSGRPTWLWRGILNFDLRAKTLRFVSFFIFILFELQNTTGPNAKLKCQRSLSLTLPSLFFVPSTRIARIPPGESSLISLLLSKTSHSVFSTVRRSLRPPKMPNRVITMRSENAHAV